MLGSDAMRAIREFEFKESRMYPTVSQVNLLGRVGGDYLVRARVNGRAYTYRISAGRGGFAARKVADTAGH